MKKFALITMLILLFAVAQAFNQLYFKGLRIDLTENKVYSISQGSRAVIDELPDNVVLTLYFSDQASKGLISLRAYSDQVQTLLREYEASSQGKIRLDIVDPVAFSEQEDAAARYGLTAVPIDNVGNSAYFGLIGTIESNDSNVENSAETLIVVTIPFFDPSKESFLEYDVSKLLYQLSAPTPVKVALIGDFPNAGGQDPMTGQYTPTNAIYSQLKQFFDLTIVSSIDASLPMGTELLIAVHPKNLSQSLLYDIDQFIMSGGQAMFFVDPHFESDPMSMRGALGVNASDTDLLASYGITLQDNKIVLDALTGLDIQTSSGKITRHLGFLGLGTQQIDRDDVTTADLESVNGASFGALILTQESGLVMQPLISSSLNSGLVASNFYANTRDPDDIAQGFVDLNTAYTLAARLNGPANSYFDVKPDVDVALDLGDANQIDKKEATEHIANSQHINLVVFADADMFADRFWVQQSSFFGQTVYSPFANNADLVINLAENISGSKGLIGVRSRGTLARPFTKVEALEVLAQAKFSEQQKALEAQLAQIESDLQKMQLQQGSDTIMTIEQNAAIEQFNVKRIEIRKALRDVKFQLDKDIDDLGTRLKLINIAVSPFVLVLLLWLLFKLTRRKAPREGYGVCSDS